MNNYKSDKIERVDLQQFNRLLDIACSETVIRFAESEEEYYQIRAEEEFYFSKYSILITHKNKFDLVTKYGNEAKKPQRFRLLQPLADESEEFNGGKAYSVMQKYANIDNIRDNSYLSKLCQWMPEEKKYFLSASPLIDFNRKFNHQVIDGVWSYDLNSAYSSIALEGIPNVKRARRYDYVRKGEIGFELNCHLTLVHEGGYADIVMPLVKNEGLIKFCRHYFELKKTSPKGSKERDKAKFYLNASIGCLQKYNPFVRAYIVNRCTEVILNVLNSNCILWNTDGFYTKERRTDLNIGDGIGQFKEEYIEKFRLENCTYQKNEEIPVWRGVEKSYFKQFQIDNGRPFILGEDELPDLNLVFYFDKETFQIKEKIYGKTK